MRKNVNSDYHYDIRKYTLKSTDLGKLEGRSSLQSDIVYEARTQGSPHVRMRPLVYRAYAYNRSEDPEKQGVHIRVCRMALSQTEGHIPIHFADRT